VKDDVDVRLPGDALAIDLDPGGAGVDLGPELGDDAPVDADASRRDDRLSGATGGKAGFGEDFLEADGGHWGSVIA
jgi:hypothetical protein